MKMQTEQLKPRLAMAEARQAELGTKVQVFLPSDFFIDFSISSPIRSCIESSPVQGLSFPVEQRREKRLHEAMALA